MSDVALNPNLERAAVLMMGLGSEAAANVMKHLGSKDMQELGVAMTLLDGVKKEKIEAVLNEFVTALEEQTGIGMHTDDYVKDVLTHVLGQEKANSLLERIVMGAEAKGLESLKWMDAATIFDLIRFEHPQVQSIILAYLSPEQTASILAFFPEATRAHLIMRVASLDKIQANALQELNEIMVKKFKETSGGQSRAMGGLKSAAEIMNYIDTSTEVDILGQIKEKDERMAIAIEELMFVFENLLDFNDRDIQILLREVNSDNLLLALKGADTELKTKIFNNMSKRAAQMLKDDLEAKGPVKLKEVEAAQKAILETAKKLSEAGEISLSKSGEEMI